MPYPFTERGSGPPVVFLHAFPLSASMWDSAMNAAANGGFRGIAPDFPGFGANRDLTEITTPSAAAEGVIDLLESIRIPRAAFVGLSMGGYVLFEVLRRAPQIVSAAVFCDTTCKADDEEKKRGRFALIDDLETIGSDALVDAMLPELVSDKTVTSRPAIVENIRSEMMAASAEAAAAALRGMAERVDNCGVLENIGLPVHFLFGSDDALTGPEEALRMARIADGPEPGIVYGAGHYSCLESAPEFERQLMQFLKSLDLSH